MAQRPNVKEILEMARRAGPAKPNTSEAPEVPPTPPPEPASLDAGNAPPEIAEAPEAPVAAAAPANLGRPLTLQEKLAAARAGGAAKPAAAKPAPRPAASPAPAPPTADGAGGDGVAPIDDSPAQAPPPPAPSPASLGRPLTLQEKLAAARAGGGAAAPASNARPAGAKPPAAAKSAGTATKTARALPPLETMTDPRDLAEALRQAAAKKAKEAEQGKAAPPKAPAGKTAPKEKDGKATTALPRPPRAVAESAAVVQAERRGFLLGSLFVSWILLGWAGFIASVGLVTGMLGRFMFPNVLAEPPSTIKIGLPSNFEPEDVNERFKAEWGFWVVRTTRYNGEDVLFALQSVCTHLGCPPNWLSGEQKFKCPCHGSGFYISGINFEGPAPRPLERFKVTLADDGQIVVDKSQKFQQELGQWEDPDSFITA